MTVQELIEELQKHPATTPVYVRSYEFGYDAVGSTKSLELIENPSDDSEHSYEGAFLTKGDREMQSLGWMSIPIKSGEEKLYHEGLVFVGDSREVFTSDVL